ncbi:hypothetical protein ML462_05030 [Gramella lutea]|uniref:Uncharacterized protein n=1 Tax=Christiangramia lutea TaxID=1607951 RepID=A0A9X1V1S0_9FLAO|nr:hypothetical protein [Christiangramia lutea]MCH4822529.1 hypothetical protein [Christiangramia lutea]
MNLNTKLVIFLFLFTGILSAQEEEKINANQYTEDPETVFFNVELFYPVSIGNSVYSEYDFDPGYAIDFNWFFKPELTLGVRFAVHRGYPKNISETGNIDRGAFHLIGIDFGYYKAFNRKWNLSSRLGIGLNSAVYVAPEDKFSEEGGKVWVHAEIAHRLDKTIAFFFKTGIDHDFWDIETSDAKNSYFNNHFLLNAGIGFRINLQNPGG